MLKVSSKSVESEVFTPEMKDLLEKIQKSAISLSVDMSELVGVIKRLDPKYAAQIEKMEKS